MNKSRVKAFLDVMSKDDIRPVFCHALLDWYEDRPVLVATDTYILAAINLDFISKDNFEQYKGKLIHRDQITRWYKLANTRDILTTDEILQMATSEAYTFPKWQILLGADQEATTRIKFNANYALTLEKLAGNHLGYELHGPMGVMLAKNSTGTYALMPLKP